MNNADMQSTGFELDLGWRDRIKDFDYGVHLLLSDDRQKILKYPNTTGKITRGMSVNIMEIYGDSKPLA